MEYCTYFDRNYLCQGLALYDSLRRWSHSGFRLWILCLDDDSRAIIESLTLADVKVVTRTELIASEPGLAEAESNRSEQEFFYACTPALVQYVMQACPESAGVTYLDADMYFFGRPQCVYDRCPAGTQVIILPHDSGNHKLEQRTGRFNVSLVHFASGGAGTACLQWWLERCLESTRFGDGVWGDQKYLDRFPHLVANVAVASTPTVKLAPWNVAYHQLQQDGNGSVTVDGEPLTVYHFGRHLVLSEHFAVPSRRNYIPRGALTLLYRSYMRACRTALRQIKSIRPDYQVRHTRHNLRGVALGTVTGRVFYEGSLGLRRIGIYIPTPVEVKAWREGQRLRDR
jgi:hypothetical protein